MLAAASSCVPPVASGTVPLSGCEPPVDSGGVPVTISSGGEVAEAPLAGDFGLEMGGGGAGLRTKRRGGFAGAT